MSADIKEMIISNYDVTSPFTQKSRSNPESPALVKWTDRQQVGLDREDRMLVRNTEGLCRARGHCERIIF